MRIGDYPIPSYACYIWYSGDSLRLLMPPTTEHDRSNTVSIPIERCGVLTSGTGEILPSQRGWLAILQTLQSRSTQREPATISTPAAPSQWDLDAVMRALGDGKVTRIEKKKNAPERLALEDLDL